YRVRNEDGHILAEKGRFSRWGPYVNRIGLIIILIDSIFRMSPFLKMEGSVWTREGAQQVIPGTSGEEYIANTAFSIEMYAEDDARLKDAIARRGGRAEKTFQSNVVVYKNTDVSVPGAEPKLEKVKEGQIELNHPLKFDGYALYQSGFQENEFS